VTEQGWFGVHPVEHELEAVKHQQSPQSVAHEHRPDVHPNVQMGPIQHQPNQLMHQGAGGCKDQGHFQQQKRIERLQFWIQPLTVDQEFHHQPRGQAPHDAIQKSQCSGVLREKFAVDEPAAQHQAQGTRQTHDQDEDDPKSCGKKHPTDAIAVFENRKNQIVEMEEAHKQNSADRCQRCGFKAVSDTVDHAIGFWCA
jgi:hypothetical protein